MSLAYERLSVVEGGHEGDNHARITEEPHVVTKAEILRSERALALTIRSSTKVEPTRHGR